MNRIAAVAVVTACVSMARAQTITSEIGDSNGDGYGRHVARLSPASMGCGPGGLLTVGDERAYQLRQVNLAADGETSTLVGTGSQYGGVAVAPDGTIYASDPFMGLVWRIGGPLQPPAAPYAGSQGNVGFGGDGGPAMAAALNSPMGLALDSAGNLYIADSSNQRIRRVDAVTKVITTVAGGGACADNVCDGGPATSGRMAIPIGVAVDPITGDVYVADRLQHRVRAVRRATGTIATVAGTGAPGGGGNGGLATAAQVNTPNDVAVGPDGSLYIADTRNNAVRRVRPDGIIERIAGTGQAGAGADGPAATSKLDLPRTVEWCANKLWVGEQGLTNRVRAIDLGAVPATPTAALPTATHTATNPPTATSTPVLTATRTHTPTPAYTATRTMTATPTCSCCNQCG